MSLPYGDGSGFSQGEWGTENDPVLEYEQGEYHPFQPQRYEQDPPQCQGDRTLHPDLSGSSAPETAGQHCLAIVRQGYTNQESGHPRRYDHGSHRPEMGYQRRSSTISRSSAGYPYGLMPSPNSSSVSGPSQVASDITEPFQNYVLRSSSFFCLGRVFGVVWSEGLSDAQSHPPSGASTPRLSNVSRNEFFNTGFYTKRVHMIVVRQRRGCSWAVPINSYRNQGCKKQGIDLHAHAIAYMNNNSPVPLPGEPPLSKEAIMVKMSSSYHKIKPASRINFSKVHTVEHRVKVQDIGMVQGISLNFLLQYFQDECNKHRWQETVPQ